MRILRTFPPNFREINAKFNVRGKPVIFTYGPIIFNPSGLTVTPALMAHEMVHCERQGENPSGWWIDYLRDEEFRLGEELPAHRAEYAAMCTVLPESKARSTALHRIAARLSSPLYGSMIEYEEARRRITA